MYGIQHIQEHASGALLSLADVESLVLNKSTFTAIQVHVDMCPTAGRASLFTTAILYGTHTIFPEQSAPLEAGTCHNYRQTGTQTQRNLVLVISPLSCLRTWQERWIHENRHHADFYSTHVAKKNKPTHSFLQSANTQTHVSKHMLPQ